jgi:hypothetical protein
MHLTGAWSDPKTGSILDRAGDEAFRIGRTSRNRAFRAKRASKNWYLGLPKQRRTIVAGYAKKITVPHNGTA